MIYFTAHLYLMESQASRIDKLFRPFTNSLTGISPISSTYSPASQGECDKVIGMKPERRSTLQCDTIIGDSELVAATVSDSEMTPTLSLSLHRDPWVLKQEGRDCAEAKKYS